jgi:hypothetical protein
MSASEVLFNVNDGAIVQFYQTTEWSRPMGQLRFFGTAQVVVLFVICSQRRSAERGEGRSG